MNNSFIIEGLAGERKLRGSVQTPGAKNAALKVIAATILFRDIVTLTNIPQISDVVGMFDLLKNMGAEISQKNKKTRNQENQVNFSIFIPKNFLTDITPEIAKHMRASVVVMGPVLARFGKVSFPHPGGCLIGARPIDFFLQGFEKMGATVTFKNDLYTITAPQGLKGAEFFLKNPSVTATETFMMAGVLARGTTVIKNAAMEPEIEDLAKFLNKSGAKITGMGTATITIKGGKLLSCSGHTYTTMPDRIDASSFLILGALAATELHITHCNPKHLEALIEILRDTGVSIQTKKTEIIVSAPSSLVSTNIKTHEYPGLATDIQAPLVVLLTQAVGDSTVFETIFEGRLNYSEELVAMGADITMMSPHRILIRGKFSLHGRNLTSPDLRAGLAFIIAAIIAKGESVIHNVDTTIDRGYEDVENRLRSIGVKISRL